MNVTVFRTAIMRRLLPAFGWLLMLAAALSPVTALRAQTSSEVMQSEAIEIRSPYLSRMDQAYLLNAQLQFELPMDVQQTVHDGATLNFVVQLRVSRERRWWRDAVRAELEQRYQLQYHAVSERYLVRNLNSGAQTSHANFADAVASLKNIDGLPVLTQEQVSNASGNEVNLRVSIDVRSIPRALGLLLFWVDDYSLESDWYTWPLRP